MSPKQSSTVFVKILKESYEFLGHTLHFNAWDNLVFEVYNRQDHSRIRCPKNLKLSLQHHSTTFLSLIKVKSISLRRLFSYNRPEWFYILVACLASIVIGAVQPAFSIVFVKVITVLSRDPNQSGLINECVHVIKFCFSKRSFKNAIMMTKKKALLCIVFCLSLLVLYRLLVTCCKAPCSVFRARI